MTVEGGIDIPRDSRGRIMWKELRSDSVALNQAIETESRRILSIAGTLSESSLRRSPLPGSTGLIAEVQRDYPGGMVALRRVIEENTTPRIQLRATEAGLPVDQRGRIWWSHLNSDPARLQQVIELKAQSFVDEGHHLSGPALRKAGLSGFLHAIGHNYPGGITALRIALVGHTHPHFDLEVSEDQLPKSKDGRIWWSSLADDEVKLQQIIMQQARQHLAETGSLTQKSLTEARRSGLQAAITKHFPGGLIGLQEKLGVSEKRPNGFWQDPQNILSEARKFLDTRGILSDKKMRECGMGGLSGAISSNYPGGFRQLRSDLGLDVSAKPNGYWTPDQIRTEAALYHQEFGVLTQTGLYNSGRIGLSAAITTKYPGGMQQLKRDLGIDLTRKDGYWTKAIVEQEARAIVEQVGELTARKLVKLDRYDLLIAINRKYPGGMRGLKQELGLPILRRHWTSESIEQEVLAFYQQMGYLSAPVLLEHQKGALVHAITRHYPGGMRALKQNIGIDIADNISDISTQEANEQLAKLVETD